MDRYLLIINPISGTDNKAGLADFVHKCMHAFGFDLDVKYTNGPGDAKNFSIIAVQQGYRGVIAAGGDGTINEVASGICDTPTAMGIIPYGSGNGLARHLGIPLDPRQAIKTILRNRIIPFDYATVNGHPCFCTFGVGFDAKVSHTFAMQKKRGRFSYLRAMIKEAKTYQPLTYTLVTENTELTRQALIIAVCNASQYGNNAYIAPHASMLDGLLDITIVHPGNPIDLAKNSLDLFAGAIANNRRFDTMRSPSVTIRCETPMLAHIDGEPYNFGREIEITNHSRGLKVFCDGEPEFKPILTTITDGISEIRTSIRKLF